MAVRIDKWKTVGVTLHLSDGNSPSEFNLFPMNCGFVHLNTEMMHSKPGRGSSGIKNIRGRIVLLAASVILSSGATQPTVSELNMQQIQFSK